MLNFLFRKIFSIKNSHKPKAVCYNIIYMKGRAVGISSEGLLWPNRATLAALRKLSRPLNHILDNSIDDHDLLWPAGLINEQANARKQRNFAKPLALTTFILSLILGFVAGPVQLILLFTTSDYTWTTNIYFPSALRAILLIASVLGLLNLIALIIAWRSQPQTARTTIALATGSLAMLISIWIFGDLLSLQPHQLTLSLACVAVVFILVALFVNKQFTDRHKLSLITEIALSMLSVASVLVIGFGPFYLYRLSTPQDSEQLVQLATAQAAARIDGVPASLSDLTFALCQGKYQVIYLDEPSHSGLFECLKNGEVYSVTDLNLPVVSTFRAAATYLGTTKNSDVSLAFPTASYLYRSLPGALNESELVLLVSALSETELVDNITQPILTYRQAHSADNLFLNIFYLPDLSVIKTTRDYILAAALDTMIMTNQLPHGNTIRSYYNGDMIDYVYQPDTNLAALNAIGASRELYPTAVWEALKVHRHLSLHLTADEELTADSLHERLQDSFIGGE